MMTIRSTPHQNPTLQLTNPQRFCRQLSLDSGPVWIWRVDVTSGGIWFLLQPPRSQIELIPLLHVLPLISASCCLLFLNLLPTFRFDCAFMLYYSQFLAPLWW